MLLWSSVVGCLCNGTTIATFMSHVDSGLAVRHSVKMYVHAGSFHDRS